MSAEARVEGDERLRLFVALLLPVETIGRLADWQDAELARLGGSVRRVPRENLHITLAFLGSTPSGQLQPIVQALRDACAGQDPPLLGAVRYRETRSVGMIVLSDEGGRAERLALRVWKRLERLGVYTREGRRWLPHVTVARFKNRPRLSPSTPELGSVVPSDAAVMISRLRPGGAQYEVFESVSLGG
jgi:RNA 2',3'-cyclic 3'-phosphodiesterase